MSVSTPRAAAAFAAFTWIDTNRSARPVGDVGARLQVVGQRRAQRLVRLARINDLHARHSLLDQPPELQGHLQREVLFIDSAVMRPGEFSAVAGVDHDDLHAVRNISGP